MSSSVAAATEPTGNAAWTHAAEMRAARRVQSLLLPEAAPGAGGLECSGLCLQQRGVGGDFYDFLEAGSGRVAVALGDVSGKGVPAALMMATLQAGLRSHYALAAADLAGRLESVNRFFAECTASENYASLFVGEFDEGAGRLRYANCGHVPPFVLRDGLGVERLPPTATVLGLFGGWACATREIALAEGDLLILVSDGVTEATNAAGEAFGDGRLAAVLRMRRDLRVGALVRAISDEVRSFCGGEPSDDLTIVAARVRPRRPGARSSGGGPR